MTPGHLSIRRSVSDPEVLGPEPVRLLTATGLAVFKTAATNLLASAEADAGFNRACIRHSTTKGVAGTGQLADVATELIFIVWLYSVP
jgi:hypothetical protein